MGVNTRLLTFGLALLSAVFVAVAYLPAIQGPFTFDDYPNIVFAPDTQPDEWTQLTQAASHPSRPDRPVARITFALNYLAAGLDPSAYHATNIAIHALATVVLFLLLLLLSRAPRSPPALANVALAFAFAGALLWGVHPANTQAVSYIVQRMASLAALFYLGTLLVFVAWRMRHLRAQTALPLLAIFWGLALGAKLNAASAPAAWWLLEVAFFTGFRRRNLYLGGIVALGGIVGAGVVAHEHLRFFLTAPESRPYSGMERMLTQSRVLWHYVSLLVWPDAGRLQVDYEYSLSRSLTSPISTLWGLLALAAVSVAAVVAIHRQRLVWPAAGWLFFLVASSVESSFLMLDPIFEHRIYLPAALLLPGLMAPIWCSPLVQRRATPVRLGFMVLAAVLAWQTVERNQLWAQPAKLWDRDLAGGAKPGRAEANAGVAAISKGDVRQAARYFIESETAAKPTTSNAPRNSLQRAQIALLRGHYEKARQAAQLRLLRVPRQSTGAYLYGVAALRLGRLEEAREMGRQMQQRVPDIAQTAVLHALIQHTGGAKHEAVTILREWLRTHRARALPTRNFVRLYLANLLHYRGQTKAATSLYRTIVQSDPTNWSAWVNLAQIYRAAGKVERAQTIEQYLSARDVDTQTLVQEPWTSPSSAQ